MWKILTGQTGRRANFSVFAIRRCDGRSFSFVTVVVVDGTLSTLN